MHKEPVIPSKQLWLVILTMSLLGFLGFTTGVVLNLSTSKTAIPASWSDIATAVGTVLAALLAAVTTFFAYRAIVFEARKIKEAQRPYLVVSDINEVEIEFQNHVTYHDSPNGAGDAGLYPLQFSLTNFGQFPIYVRGVGYFGPALNPKPIMQFASSVDRLNYLTQLTGYRNAGGRVFAVGAHDKEGYADPALSLKNKEGLLLLPGKTEKYIVLWRIIWSQFRFDNQLRIYFQYGSTGEKYHYLPIEITSTIREETITGDNRKLSSLIFIVADKSFTHSKDDLKFQQMFMFS